MYPYNKISIDKEKVFLYNNKCKEETTKVKRQKEVFSMMYTERAEKESWKNYLVYRPAFLRVLKKLYRNESAMELLTCEYNYLTGLPLDELNSNQCGFIYNFNSFLRAVDDIEKWEEEEKKFPFIDISAKTLACFVDDYWEDEHHQDFPY